LEALKDVDAISMLVCLNYGSDVPPAFGRMAVNGGAEASFTIDEPGDVPG